MLLISLVQGHRHIKKICKFVLKFCVKFVYLFAYCKFLLVPFGIFQFSVGLFTRLHGPSVFTIKEKNYGVLYNQSSSVTFDETSCYWSTPKSSNFWAFHWSPHGSLLVWQHTLVSPSAFSRREVVSYWRKYVQEVLINHLGGLSLPRKSVVRLADCPNMT